MEKKNTLNSGICAFVILALLVVGCGRFGKSPSGGVGETSKAEAPSIDPNTPFPAISADALDALIADVPDLGKHREKILEAERSAINGLLADIRAKSPAGNQRAGNSGVTTSVAHIAGLKAAAPTDGDGFSLDRLVREIHLMPTAYAAENIPRVDLGGFENFIAGFQISYFQPEDGSVRDDDRGKSKVQEVKDSDGKVQATLTTSVNQDGTIGFDLATSIGIPIFGLNANSRVKLTGNQCPDADGKVNLTIELKSDGRAGSAGSVIYDNTLTAKLSATVNDDAEVASMDIDVKQATRSTAGGRQVYVETSQSGHGTTPGYSGIEWGGVRIDRASSQARQEDGALSDKGLQNASRLAQGVFESAKMRWQGGGCVKIEATAPGTVDVNSTTQIPVKVVRKLGSGEVPSKLTAELSGGTSIDPTMIPKTAGTLTYIAPGESGKTATIKLTANSRRGRATLDLTASTGGPSYQIVGGLDDFQTNTNVCDIMKPFTLTGGGITNKFSGGLSGTYNFTGPFQSKGSGTYTISLPDGLGKPGTMTGQGSGSVLGKYTRTGTENYTLTPIAPCG